MQKHKWPERIPRGLADAWTEGGLRAAFWDGVSRNPQWVSCDDEEHYRAEGNRYAPDSFSYHLSAEGFRGDDLIVPEKRFGEGGPPRVLFMGCSNTYGIGLPLEDVWSRKVWRGVCQHFGRDDVPFWNVSEGGRGLGWIARMASLAVPILRPDVVMILAPAPHRREFWNERYQIIQAFLPESKLFPSHVVDAALTWWTPEGEFFEYLRDLTHISAVCAAHGVQWMWDTWHHPIRRDDDVKGAMPAAVVEAWKGFEFQHSRAPKLARDGLHAGWETQAHCAGVVTPLAIAALERVLDQRKSAHGACVRQDVSGEFGGEAGG